MINEYLKNLTNQTRSDFYNGFGTAMYVVFLLLLLLEFYKRSFRKKEILYIVICFMGAFLTGSSLCPVLNNLTNGIVPGANLGVAFLPFLAIFSLGCRLCKYPARPMLDMVVPIYIAGRGVCIIGCIFAGCCHGFPAEWGLYSHYERLNTVPCPVIDSAISLLIAFALICLVRKKQPRAEGYIAAYGCIAFGVLRYVIDVLRDNDKLFSMVTFEGLCGIAMVILGLIMLYLINQKERTPAKEPRN